MARPPFGFVRHRAKRLQEGDLDSKRFLDISRERIHEGLQGIKPL